MASNVNWDSVGAACDAFALYKTLTFHINRARSYFPIPKQSPLEIDQNLRAQCLSQTYPKGDNSCQYFFEGLKGKIFYINKETFNEFTATTRSKFPNFTYLKLFALVDSSTDIQLMPYSELKKVHIHGDLELDIQVRALVAKDSGIQSEKKSL